jgi:hypothetical protein
MYERVCPSVSAGWLPGPSATMGMALIVMVVASVATAVRQ